MRKVLDKIMNVQRIKLSGADEQRALKKDCDEKFEKLEKFLTNENERGKIKSCLRETACTNIKQRNHEKNAPDGFLKNCSRITFKE